MDFYLDLSMLTGAQIRAARAALGWSAQDLAFKASVATKTIMRLESVDGIPQSRTGTLLDIKAVLESAGIEFIGSPTDRPGIRFVLPRRPPE
jgi:ribosome-binding protein aMBF1 (putative translation factor)